MREDVRERNRKRLEAKRAELDKSNKSTEAIAQLSERVAQLTQAMSESGIGEAAKAIDSTASSLISLMSAVKESDRLTIDSISRELGQLADRIGSLDITPEVNIAPQDIKIPDYSRDFEAIAKGLNNVVKAVNSQEYPKPPKQDNSGVEEAVNKVNSAISSLKFPVPNYVLPFKGTNGEGTQLPIGSTGGLSIQTADSPSIDAFARWRVSNPETLFDSKQLHDDQPLFWDDQEVSGGSTTSSHSTDTASTTIGVALNTAGKRVRQTFQRFNYQPGKSQLAFITGTLGATGGGTGITRAAGLFDDNDGIFMQDDEGTIKAVIRSSASGSPVDTKVAQSAWNLDPLDGSGPSGVTLDADQSQIIVIDYEWLGVGRVRIGFVFNGIPVYVHQFVQANNAAGVYMSTPNLPVRYEIENDGTGAASTLEHICSSVISEGGVQDNGIVRYASTANTQVDCAVVGTIYAVKGIRLKSTNLDETINILNVATQVQSASDDLEYILIFNPTVAGTPSWSNETNSSVQTATGATANTVTGGTYITGGYVASGNAQNASGSIAQEIPNALSIGSAIDGTPDEIWLCARALTNVNTLVEGSITWRELS